MLIKDIKDAWLSSQIKNIEDKLGAVFEARGADDVIYHDFLLNFLKKKIGVFSGGLLQLFVGIAISTCLVGLASKIALARVLAAC